MPELLDVHHGAVELWPTWDPHRVFGDGGQDGPGGPFIDAVYNPGVELHQYIKQTEEINSASSIFLCVHMLKGNWERELLKQQAKAIESAIEKGIPLYFALIGSNGKVPQDPVSQAELLEYLPTKLAKAARECAANKIFGFFNRGTDSALTAVDCVGSSWSLWDIFAGTISNAVVIGQDVDICVKSTIFGLPGRADKPDSKRGLLDADITVITSRAVLSPLRRTVCEYYQLEFVNENRMANSRPNRGCWAALSCCTRAAL